MVIRECHPLRNSYRSHGNLLDSVTFVDLSLIGRWIQPHTPIFLIKLEVLRLKRVPQITTALSLIWTISCFLNYGNLPFLIFQVIS